MITCIFGSSESGKTTLAYKLQQLDGGIILDGNQLREVWTDLGFSLEDRYEQHRRTARLALMLEKQGHDIIIALIGPTKDIRKEVETMTNARVILLKGGIKNQEHIFEDYE